MDDTEKKTVRALVLRDFDNAGTGEIFTKSDTPVPIEEGAFGNYRAAGLVEAAPVDAEPDAPAADAPVDGTLAKPSRTRG